MLIHGLQPVLSVEDELLKCNETIYVDKHMALDKTFVRLSQIQVRENAPQRLYYGAEAYYGSNTLQILGNFTLISLGQIRFIA